MHTTVESGINSESRVRLVSKELLPYLWEPVAEVMLTHRYGLLDGFYTLEEIHHLLMAGLLDLWVGLGPNNEIDCVSLCRIERYTSFTIYRMVWGGGKVSPHLKDAMDQIGLYAREVVKADKLALDGRIGWTRKLAKLNFKVVRYEMWKSLNRSH